jgi:hypothetical protein
MCGPTRIAEQEFEKALALRAAKAAKRRLKEIEEVEELPDEICPSSCCGGPSTSGCGSVPTWGRTSGGRGTSAGSADQEGSADSGGDAVGGSA